MTAAHTELQAFLSARDAAEPHVDPALRSRVMAGTDDDVVVLLHGLTASPPAWDAIAVALQAGGTTVVTIRLPLHGYADRMTTALEGLSTELLTADVHAVIDAVARLGKRIVIGGHSLGGTLAIHAAATHPAVDRVVAIAPFLGIAGLPPELHARVVPLLRRLPNLFLWWDPIKRRNQQPEHGYPRYPLHALAVGIEIADAVYLDATRLPLARAVDLVVNAQESSVNNRAVRRLAQRWRAARADIGLHELTGLPRSHDIIEPRRPHSLRARETIVRLLRGERVESAQIRYAI